MLRNPGSRRGFTLIELLVVIAIIAILAAILFPVFAQARAKARQAQCLSNQKQLGVAFMAYVQDYDETFPMANYRITGAPDNTPWQHVIDPYVKANFPQIVSQAANKQISVYACPDWRKTGDGSVPARPSSSYGVNQNLMPSLVTNPALRVHSLAEINAPASLVLLAPHKGNCVLTTGKDDVFPADTSNCNRGYMLARLRHAEGANYLFVDGHAKWFKAPTPYHSQSRSGVVWRKSVNPNAGGWFDENN